MKTKFAIGCLVQWYEIAQGMMEVNLFNLQKKESLALWVLGIAFTEIMILGPKS